MTRSGRRPGTPDTREHIVAVARSAFGARGYDATSLRHIAKLADVDPGLLIHYFGSKEGLFRAALEITLQPDQLFKGCDGPSNREVAENIVRRYLMMLDRAQTREVVMGLIRSAVSNEHAADMLRGMLIDGMLTSLAHFVRGPDARLRASLIVAQLMGIATLKHVVRSEDVLAATDNALARLVAPAIEQYLQ